MIKCFCEQKIISQVQEASCMYNIFKRTSLLSLANPHKTKASFKLEIVIKSEFQMRPFTLI